jgi:rhodanese-related sulfurtransferase
VSHRPFKQRLYAQFARVGNALASDKRLELLDLLAQAPRNVEALAAEMETPVANVSQHLQVLRNARLVDSVRQGTRIIYRLADEEVLHLWLGLRSVAESRLTEVRPIVEEFTANDRDRPTVYRGQLERLMIEGRVFIIDVRPRLEYENGHLPGAISIPVGELPEHLDELPRDRQIIAYCRGTYCLFADEAVALLCNHGFDAYRLDGGLPEWRAEGRPLGEASTVVFTGGPSGHFDPPTSSEPGQPGPPRAGRWQ